MDGLDIDLSALETLVFGNTSFHNVTTIAVKGRSDVWFLS